MIRLPMVVFFISALFMLPGCGSGGAGKDIVPSAFSFAPRTDAPLSAYIVSDPATIAGIDAPAPVHVSGGEYSIDGGLFTSADGTVIDGQAIRVRHTTAGSPGISTTTMLTVGGISVSFISTTGVIAADTAPDPFGFTPQIDVAPGVTVTSDAVTITGINTAAPVMVVGEPGSNFEYSIDGGPFGSNPGMVAPGETIRVRHTSTTAPGITVTTSLSVGGVSGSFSSTTAGDAVPDPFSFTMLTGVPASTMIESESVIITGMTTTARIAVVGGEYSIDGGAYTPFSGSVSSGTAVRVRHLSASSASDNHGQVTTTLTVGGVSTTFVTVTAGAGPVADTVPDHFSFDPQAGVPVATIIVSAPITVSGINAPAAIKVKDGEYSIDGGDFTTSPGFVSEGQTVRVRHISAASAVAPGNSVTTTLTIGGVSGTFTSMT